LDADPAAICARYGGSQHCASDFAKWPEKAKEVSSVRSSSKESWLNEHAPVSEIEEVLDFWFLEEFDRDAERHKAQWD